MIKHEVIDNLSSHNKSIILGSRKCGCYHCLAKFSPEEITEWLDYDETAVCPKCRVDSVIPIDDIQNEQATKELQRLRIEYFSYYPADDEDD